MRRRVADDDQRLVARLLAPRKLACLAQRQLVGLGGVATAGLCNSIHKCDYRLEVSREVHRLDNCNK